MSLRYLSLRLPKNIWCFLRDVVSNRRPNILEAKNPNRAGRRFISDRPIRSVGYHARRVLISDASRETSDLRRRLTRRLFYGDSVPAFALIGLTLSAGNGLLSQEEEEEVQSYKIRDTVSKYLWKFDALNPNNLVDEGEMFLKDIEIGSFISKGCSAVVYSAKMKNETKTESNTNFPLTLKIMFNYDIQSCSMAILNAMYKETIPARCNRIYEQMPLWRNLFQRDRSELPPHPNIVAMYNVFADYMPNLTGSMELYPDALPSSFNPSGLGRNMTLFLLMKRYESSLKEYLNTMDLKLHDSIILMAQLLEGIAHLSKHSIAHRDLKSDNILIDNVPFGKDCYIPHLVITDFGCCLTDSQYGLRIPYKSSNVDKGGNVSLMAPEILLQQPGFFNFLDYRKSDLWAAGAIAYEIFGHENPFVVDSKSTGEKLRSMDYEESQLPAMNNIPTIIQRLIKNLLSRDPNNRLNPDIAANVCHLYLWAPKSWITSKKMPSSQEIFDWLGCLTMKIICEPRLFDKYSDNENDPIRNANPEYVLIASFLSRVHMSQIHKTLSWIKYDKM